MSSAEKKLTYQEVLKLAWQVLRHEPDYYVTAVIYGAAVSVLTLAIPISVQSLVNTIAFGVLIQPLVILSVVLLLLLVLSGFFNAMQTYVIELFQRKFYARICSEIVIRLINARPRELDENNGVELVNRYFDIMTVQKKVSQLLIGLVSVILQTVVGLLLLALYHPYFLAFDILLVLMLWAVWIFYGNKAILTAVEESKAKYVTAHWFEEVAQANIFLKTEKRKEMALKKSDELIQKYLEKRTIHFRRVFRQIIMLLGIYAVMSALILGLGGFLVVEGQLTLGQLVAAELIITLILGSFAKSGKYLEAFYDLVAGAEKLSHFFSLSLEKNEKTVQPLPASFDLTFKNAVYVTDRYEVLFNLEFKEGEKYFIHTRNYSSETIFLDMIRGVSQPHKGQIMYGNLDYQDLSRFELRDHIYVIEKPIVIHGTIEENLSFGMHQPSKSKINEVLDLVDLSMSDSNLPSGIKTELHSSGYPLWSSQLIRLEIARALLQQPKILVLTDAFDQLDRQRRERIIQKVFKKPMTIIMFSSFMLKDIPFDHFMSMDRGRLVEHRSFDEMQKHTRLN